MDTNGRKERTALRELDGNTQTVISQYSIILLKGYTKGLMLDSRVDKRVKSRL